MGKHTRLKKLAKHLLATTCLTAGAAALANAQVTEGAGGLNDFGNTFGGAFILPVGTTSVTGNVGGNITSGDSFVRDPADFFTFSGLQGGSAFSFTASIGNRAGSTGVEVENSGGTDLLGSPFIFTSFNESQAGITNGSGTVPLDGKLTFGLGSSIEFQDPYGVSLTASLASPTPEPGTIGLLGIGLAAGAFLRRRKKNQ